MPPRYTHEDTAFMAHDGLDQLIHFLVEAEYTVLGPSLHQGALAYGPIRSATDIPTGFKSEEGPGQYRLCEGEGNHLFDALPGSDSWKRFLFPPRSELYSASQAGGQLRMEDLSPVMTGNYAFVGVRSCDLAAIQVMDRTFAGGPYPDPNYTARRDGVFIVTVGCTHPGETCFCYSMGTGPWPEAGYELNLTEIDHGFLVQPGSLRGAEFIDRLEHRPAEDHEIETAHALFEQAVTNMGRSLDTAGLPEFLLSQLNHPHWDEVAQRCLGCTNCTIVCPTCFCWTTKDRVDLSGKNSTRERVWDSCFNPAHSYLAGGRARPDIRSRYRQWLTHKLGSWVLQYGVMGCVGCGRCITWCPAEIDITEEVRLLRKASSGASPPF